MKAPFRLIAVVALLGVGTAALAAAFNGPFGLNVKLPSWLSGGVYVGSGSVLSTTNKITTALAPALVSWDFPACSTSGFAGATECHNHTNAVAITGLKIGDECHVTSDHGVGDGGLPDSAFFDAIIVDTGLAAVREHYSATDAGVYDAPDSGYAIRCFSNQ